MLCCKIAQPHNDMFEAREYRQSELYSTTLLRNTETLRCRKEKAFLHSEPALRLARDLTLHTVAHVLIVSMIMPDLCACVYIYY